MLGIDVVTADGELVHASEESHADLYWAARGSGPGFFGVVTSFHLKLHDLPAVFVHTTYVFPASVFDELMHWAQALLPTLDTRVEPVIVGTRIATVADMVDANFAKLDMLRRVYDPDGRLPGFLTNPGATPNAFEPRP